MLLPKESENWKRKTPDLKRFLTRIEYKSIESKISKTNYVESTPVSIYQFTLQEKVTIFQSVFQGPDKIKEKFSFFERSFPCLVLFN